MFVEYVPTSEGEQISTSKADVDAKLEDPVVAQSVLPGEDEPLLDGLKDVAVGNGLGGLCVHGDIAFGRRSARRCKRNDVGREIGIGSHKVKQGEWTRIRHVSYFHKDLQIFNFLFCGDSIIPQNRENGKSERFADRGRTVEMRCEIKRIGRYWDKIEGQRRFDKNDGLIERAVRVAYRRSGKVKMRRDWGEWVKRIFVKF